MMAAKESLQDISFAPVLCFRHCDEGSNILCFEIPPECPCCKASLKSANFFIPPFAIPNPFHSTTNEGLVGNKMPCSLLIKPTDGNFLTTYKAGDNLHIGITDSKGNIYSYSEDGLIRESSQWGMCLAVEVVSSQSEPVTKIWDAMLSKQLNVGLWQKECYDEKNHNCYSFVLEFLNMLLRKSYGKEEFCHRYILPVTSKAADYIAIYRKVLSERIIIQ